MTAPYQGGVRYWADRVPATCAGPMISLTPRSLGLLERQAASKPGLQRGGRGVAGAAVPARLFC